MELVVLQEDIEPLPKKKTHAFVFNNEGILSSAYKNEIRENFFNSNPRSIFGIKQRVKSGLYTTNLGVETLLKFSVFVTVIVALVS